MIVLGLDVATNTGFCVGDVDRDTKNAVWVQSGVVNFEPKRGEGKGMRFLRFRRWLYDMIEEFKPGIIAYEQSHHRGGPATEVGVGLTTIVMEVGDEKEIPYATVRTSTLKKEATGKGNAGKAEMVAAANALGAPYPGGIESDDEADAIHIFRWAVENFSV